MNDGGGPRWAHIFVSACGRGVRDELQTLALSLYNHTTPHHPVHLHVMHSADNGAAVNTSFMMKLRRHLLRGMLNRQRFWVESEVLPVIKDAEWTGHCASLRLAIASAHPELDAALYLDIDTLVLADIHRLYEHLERFSPPQCMGMVQEHESRGRWHQMAHRPFGSMDTGTVDLSNHDVDLVALQSGVLLMDLSCVRRSGFVEWAFNSTLQRAIHEGHVASRIEGIYGHLGDQDMLNFWVGTHRAQLYILPCEWNFYIWDDCIDESINVRTASLLHGSGGLFKSNRNRWDQAPWASRAFIDKYSAFYERYIDERRRLYLAFDAILDTGAAGQRSGDDHEV